jgi:hypothetical protein
MVSSWIGASLGQSLHFEGQSCDLALQNLEVKCEGEAWLFVCQCLVLCLTYMCT